MAVAHSAGSMGLGASLSVHMAPAPLVSVILPTFNRAPRLLGRAIRSVLAQSYENFELIVIDDGSDEPVQAYVESFLDSRVRLLVHDSNLGVAAARNTGIAAAQGLYVAFQDSDDEWLVDKLEKQVSALQGCDQDVVCVGVVLRQTRESLRRLPRMEQQQRGVEKMPSWLLGCEVVYVQSLLLYRAILAEIGGFDTSLTMCEDLDLMLRLARKVRWKCQHESYVFSAREADSLTQEMSLLAQAQWAVLEKNSKWLMSETSELGRMRYRVARAESRYGCPRRAVSYFIRALAADPWYLKAWAGLLVAVWQGLVWRHPIS